MDIKAFSKTVIGIISGIGLGLICVMIGKILILDWFGIEIKTKLVWLFSGVGIILNYVRCWFRDYLKQKFEEIEKKFDDTNEKIDKKVDSTLFMEFQRNEHDKIEEILTTVTHIRDTMDKILMKGI